MRAIVLSGGGARGAYQIGAWKAFRKLGLKFDIVTGTSVGAFNGALMVQNDFRKAYKIWKKMNYSFVFSDEISLDDKKELIRVYAKNLIKYGGMNVDALEENVKKHLNFKKFNRSNIDFGMVTYNLSDKRETKITKKDIDETKFGDYLMASATCFPAFRKKIIDGDAYIDGGYVNDLPLDVAISLGATEIIAINIGTGGVRKNVDTKNLEIKVIKPRNQLDSFFGFDQKTSRRMLKLGENDVLKEYSLLDGDKYTFKKGKIRKAFNKYQSKYMEKSVIVLGEGATYRNFASFFEHYELSFLKMLENGAEIFKLKYETVYSISKFNRELKKAIKRTRVTNVKDVLNSKNIIQSHLVKYMYDLLVEEKYIEVKRLSLLFKKEFAVALYVYII